MRYQSRWIREERVVYLYAGLYRVASRAVLKHAALRIMIVTSSKCSVFRRSKQQPGCAARGILKQQTSLVCPAPYLRGALHLAPATETITHRVPAADTADAAIKPVMPRARTSASSAALRALTRTATASGSALLDRLDVVPPEQRVSPPILLCSGSCSRDQRVLLPNDFCTSDGLG